MVVLVHFLRRSSSVPGHRFGNGLHHVAVMDRRLSHNYLQSSEKIEGQSCWLAKWNEVQSIWINFFWWGDLLRALLQLYHLSLCITILIQRFICQSQSWRQSQSQSSDEIDDKRIAAFSDCNARSFFFVSSLAHPAINKWITNGLVNGLWPPLHYVLIPI